MSVQHADHTVTPQFRPTVPPDTPATPSHAGAAERLLRSPLRRLVAGHLCQIRYAGRRTGRTYSVTVSFVRTASGIIVVAGKGAEKTWWRNFTSERPALVLVDGRWVQAVGLVLAEAASREQALAAYCAGNRHVHSDTVDPVVHFRLDKADAVAPDAPARMTGRWVGATTAGELVGFCAPAATAALVAGRGPVTTVVALVAAGFVEGYVLGAFQGVVMRRLVPQLPARRWALATSVGAAIAWTIGMMPSTLHDTLTQLPVAVLVVLGVAAGLVLLTSIGTLQWLVMRRYVDHCARWIPTTALGWCLGLAAFMAVAMPLWHPGQSNAALVIIGVGAAVVMAATVGLTTSFALPRDAHTDPDRHR